MSLHRAQEVKESPFFRSLDWQMVFLQKVKVYPGVGWDPWPLTHADAQPLLCAVPSSIDPPTWGGECS